MTAPAYTRTADTLLLTELRKLKITDINYVRQTSNVLHAIIARHGNFMPESELRENISSDVVYEGGETATDYMPDQQTTGNLGTAVTDPMTAIRSTIVSTTFNLNFKQSQLQQLNPSYIRGVLRGDFAKFYDSQERLLVIGDRAGSTINRNAPFLADADWTAGKPLSLASLFMSGTTEAGTDGDEDEELWMGIKANDVDSSGNRSQPFRIAAGNADGSELLDDLDEAIAKANWGSGHSPTDLISDFPVYSKIKGLHKDKAALRNPMVDDLSIPIESFAYGLLWCYWHRDLASHASWDYRNVGNEAVNPCLLLNGKALEMHVVTPGQDIAPDAANTEGLTWLSDLTPGQFNTHETKTSLYKRVAGSYAYHFNAERGSNAQVTDLNLS